MDIDEFGPMDCNLVTVDDEEVACLLAVEEDGFIKVASNKVKPKSQPKPQPQPIDPNRSTLSPIIPNRPPQYP
jgi:hypothetical protein